MKQVIAGGQRIFIDDEDYDFVMSRSWTPLGVGLKYLAHKKKYLHRLLLNAKDGDVVDHINGQKFDNRKSNLRICSIRQNQMNQKPQNITKTAIFKGVGWHGVKNNYRAYIKIYGKAHHLGNFKTTHEAAFAYDMKAFELFGEYARQNLACSKIHHIANTIKP